ncbi:hypothetical protein CCP3SC5AM1_3010002 [Gammaproteobacteria bacterium]
MAASLERYCLLCLRSKTSLNGEQLKLPNKALHRTAIPLRSIAAGELGRWASQ